MEHEVYIPTTEKVSELIRVESFSAASKKHPERNEDTILVNYENNIFGVFDGMGGYEAGEKASKMASEIVLEEIKKNKNLKTIFESANKQIIDEAAKDGTEMGTTAVVGLIQNEQMLIMNVGDSRAYLLRDGSINKITVDDDVAKYQYKNNLEKAISIQNKLSDFDDMSELTDEEKIYYQKRNVVSSSMGRKENFNPQSYLIDIKKGDKILFCSDGISDNLKTDEIKEIMYKNNASEELVRKSIERSEDMENLRAKKDDMSAVIVTVNGIKEERKNIFQKFLNRK